MHSRLKVRIIYVVMLVASLGYAMAARADHGLTVGADGTLYRDGEVFRAIGVNYFDAFVRTLDYPENTSYREGFAYLGEKGIPFVRFAACGYWPVQLQQYIDDKESYFKRLDDVVAAAEENNVGLIPSLVWYHATIPDVVGEPISSWGNPDSKTIAFMKQYARDVISRYVDSPAILAWEFGNEFLLHADLPNAADHRPRLNPEKGTPETRGPGDDYSFEDTMVAYAEFAKVARSLDPNRPLSTGEAILRRSAYHQKIEGTWTIDSKAEFEKHFLNCFPDPYEIASMHVYPETRTARFGEDNPMPIAELFKVFKQAAAKGNKPLFVGEFGVAWPSTIPDETERLATFTNTVEALVANQIPLASFWVYDFLNPEQHHNIIYRNAKVGNDKEWIINYLSDANQRLNSQPNVNITLKGGTQPGAIFPVLRIQINRNGVDEGVITVRFPEMIEALDATTGSFMKFYQDNRSPDWPAKLECEPLGLPVEWQGDRKNIHYSMKLDNGMVLHSSAKVEGTTITLSHKLTNHTSLDLKEVKMWNCVQNRSLPNVDDPKMERTSTLSAGRYQLFKAMIPASKEYTDTVDPVLQRFAAFQRLESRNYNEWPHIVPHPGFPDDPDQRIYFWESPKTLDYPIIATLSKDGKWGVATKSPLAPGVWSNPGISCQHADYAYPLCRAGETIEVVNTVVVFEGTPSQINVD